MTHTTKQILVAIAGAAVVALGIYKVSDTKETTFKQVNIDYSNTVLNTTSSSYLDTIIHTGLTVQEIKDVSVVIKPMNPKVKNSFEEGNLEAFINVKDSIYNIYIDNISRDEAVTVLSHELVHLQQYRSNNLQIKNGVPQWYGKDYDISLIPYSERPWEMDAFSKQNNIIKQIKSKLYQ